MTEKIEFEDFLTEDKIRSRIREMGAELTRDYRDIATGESPLLVVPILRGSFIFAADLVREIRVPLQIDFIEVSSYEGTETSGQLKWHKKLRTDLKNRHVLIVEDIIDTGLTISGVLSEFLNHKTQSIKVCSLLHKPSRERVKVAIDYKGFTIEDRFVVGYGLDFDERFREMKEIAVAILKP